MEFDLERIVFEADDLIVYNIEDLLPRHRHYPRGAHDVIKPNGKPAVTGRYREAPGRSIERLYVHHTAGSVKYGEMDGVMNTARFFVRDPTYKPDGRPNYNGRGWPGFAYTFYINYKELRHKGKPVVFQTNPLSRVTWHTKGANTSAISVVCQGCFNSRHHGNRARPGQTGHPSDFQMAALTAFVDRYAGEELGITRDRVLGHCHAPVPKKACPGDDLEAWVMAHPPANLSSEERPGFIFAPVGMIKLDDWKIRQAALVYLGHDLGKYGPNKNGVDGDPGHKTRLAIEAHEASVGLPENGHWDDTFDHIIRLTLMAVGCTEGNLRTLT